MEFPRAGKGQVLWDGMRDICRFIELTKELGLYLIVRPSPYICSEWEFGGLPAWLLKDRNMRLRCSYGPYLQAVKEYYEVLIPKLVPYQVDQGGTSFGFMSGKNGGCKTCDVTSYDYDSPLTEDGQITKKYELCKEVIGRYRKGEEVPLSTEIKRKTYGQIACLGKVDLFSVVEYISTPVHSLYPLTMEEVNQNYGYILYRLTRREQEPVTEIALEGAADRVQGYINKKLVFTAFADTIWETFKPESKECALTIDLLCENMSRENFGTGLERQRKGISEGVRVNGHRHFGYDMYPLPLEEEQLDSIDFTKGYTGTGPAFYRFEFGVEEQADTFLDLEGFGKGCAFINGFNLGRFWEIGPQKRLYLPGPLLKKGTNTILVFETEAKAAEHIRLEAEPKLG